MIDFSAEIASLSSSRSDHGETPQLRRAGDADLAALRGLVIPETVVRFYELAEPAARFTYEDISLWPISGVLELNTRAVPGIASSQYGLVAIATTVCGDAYCIDVNINVNRSDQQGLPPVHIVSHDEFEEDASEEEVRTNSHQVCDTFLEFLQRFTTGKLPYDIIHAPTYDPDWEEPSMDEVRRRLSTLLGK